MGVVVVFFAWSRVGRRRNVTLGMLAMFFVQGGTLGVIISMLLEGLEMPFWQRLQAVTGCDATAPADPNNPDAPPRTLIAPLWYCNVQLLFNNVLGPGLVEETFKAIWLFWRLRRGADELPDTCCFCLPAKHSYDLGCWFKLAPTPYHVFLCALALGAGFESIENVMYSLSGGAGVSLLRVATSGLHMCWTSLVGFGLARRFFLPEGRRPSLVAVVLPSVLLHGAFDYSIFAYSSTEGLPNAVTYFFIALFLAVLVGSFVGIFWLTSCCSADFFERRTGVTARELPVGSIACQVGAPIAVCTRPLLDS